MLADSVARLERLREATEKTCSGRLLETNQVCRHVDASFSSIDFFTCVRAYIYTHMNVFFVHDYLWSSFAHTYAIYAFIVPRRC